MEWLDQIATVQSLKDAIRETLQSDIGKMVIGGIIGGAYSVYRKWRTTGDQMLKRLDEFLEQQEERLSRGRKDVSSLIQIPSPARPIDLPVFSSKAVSELLYRLDWGYGPAAVDDLNKSVGTSSEKAGVAEKRRKEHAKRELLAHLLLGAKAAANQSDDPGLNDSFRTDALRHFQDALNLDSKDPEALEFAGTTYLQLANADAALNLFNDLVEVRKSDGGYNLARAYRLQASAFENLADPSYGNANTSLNEALRHIPGDRASDRAVTLEHQALVRITGLPSMLPGAAAKLDEAEKIYLSLNRPSELPAALKRINRSRRLLRAAQGLPPLPPIVPAEPQRPVSGFWAKLGLR